MHFYSNNCLILIIVHLVAVILRRPRVPHTSAMHLGITKSLLDQHGDDMGSIDAMERYVEAQRNVRVDSQVDEVVDQEAVLVQSAEHGAESIVQPRQEHPKSPFVLQQDDDVLDQPTATESEADEAKAKAITSVNALCHAFTCDTAVPQQDDETSVVQPTEEYSGAAGMEQSTKEESSAVVERSHGTCIWFCLPIVFRPVYF